MSMKEKFSKFVFYTAVTVYAMFMLGIIGGAFYMYIDYGN